MSKKDSGDTPAMRQFKGFKARHPDCVLFFRMGDFYEMFYEDAKLAHKVLGVALTQRSAGIPMAGVPYHSVETYLHRMIRAGYRVAVCDQVEDAALAKGVVKRDVTRVVTPGTLTDEGLLDEAVTNPLAAVMFADDDHATLAWAELSTGAFSLGSFKADELTDELSRISPSELLFVETANHQPPKRVAALIDAVHCAHAARPAWQFRQDEAIETLCKQFQVNTLSGFGLDDKDPALGPASAIIHYLLETQHARSDSNGVDVHRRIGHLHPPRRFDRRDHLIIDQTSLRSLEIEKTIRSGDAAGSLLGTLNDCRTAMGKRLLRQWLCYPLCKREPIELRQRAVGAMVEDTRFLDDLREALSGIYDVERIMGRIAVGRAKPRDLVSLGQSAAGAKALVELTDQRPAVKQWHDCLSEAADCLDRLNKTIEAACVEAPPAHLREGGLIRDGYDKQLDESRQLQRDSSVWLAKYQKEQAEASGIATMKIGFNKVFGYYLEVSAAHKDKAPEHWSRKQTLKNAERYTTPELKEYETKVLSARQRSIDREQVLFAKLCNEAKGALGQLRVFAQQAAELDVLACFARRAVKHRYIKPNLVDEPALDVVGARHPVLDQLLGDRFVPNDIKLGKVTTPEPDDAERAGHPDHRATSDPALTDSSSPTLALITGPNMAGKSTYIRQTALLVLLAHTGSFVPADRATIGLCDRIFTRIGASDELHTGQSTFMVEMIETANICHHATDRSLVILDEIGRGTSTLDGLSLAWAIAEHMAQRRCRTLFATHYHEITQLADQYENVTNLNVTVREWQDQIVFLHRIVHGATDRSYGIHVAKIAGIPQAVVDRAHDLLDQLVVSHEGPGATPGIAVAGSSEVKPQQGESVPGQTGSTDSAGSAPADQMSLFTSYLEHPAIDELRETDLNAMTPLQVFDFLRRLKEELDNE